MDNFSHFFELLKTIVAKSETPLVPDAENFSLYMANRYLSFIHPEICKLLAQTTNIYGFCPEDEKASYGVLKAIVPKMRYRKIPYVSKPSSANQSELGVTDADLEEMARYYELGKGEIRELLLKRTMLNRKHEI